MIKVCISCIFSNDTLDSKRFVIQTSKWNQGYLDFLPTFAHWKECFIKAEEEMNWQVFLFFTGMEKFYHIFNDNYKLSLHLSNMN